MTENQSAIVGLEEADQPMTRNSHVSLDAKPGPNRSDGSSQPPASSDKTDAHTKQTQSSTTKQPVHPDIAEAQATLRQAFPHVYATGRAASTRSSTSSLQALNEDIVVDARSDQGSVGQSPRRESRHSDTRPEYPVYPDQSYASLQSQIHPTYHLRSRSSYPTQAETATRIAHVRAARTAGNTPVSSPGLFSMRSPRNTPPLNSEDEGSLGSPFLHPSHLQPPKETHTAEVDRDLVTGNKVINQYEILEELGRGEHGKVKLGQHVATKQKVAIKIVQRYSNRRRLGKLGNPEDKVKKEVAILKKARHPNVVSLLEVIDDPNRQKVYIVLEYVENGEIIWRKKGVREIVHVDKLRLDREKAGIPDTPAFLEESHQFIRTAQYLRRQREKARRRVEAQAADAQQGPIPAWSLEHGVESSDEEEQGEGLGLSMRRSSTRSTVLIDENSPSQSSANDSLAAVEGSMYGAYSDFPFERRFSTASSSFGYAPSEPDWSADTDDLSYVPCLTVAEARSAFRDSVLGLEYLHFQGIIHRDIKPANLLVTSGHRVKISDFGVSYLGRPMRDEEEEQLGETDATELDDARELSKTVGTPAFYAPELCYVGDDFEETIGSVPKITGAIDVWSLGVTLYGMVFGRLPFLSDDEYSMFQTIVKKEVFIPRKRLVPVMDDSLCHLNLPRDVRDDNVLEYEDIDDELYDLLRRLLTKDPIRRITLKEIKHHPWTLYGLPNPQMWVEETDPGQQSKGKRIEVSNEEVTSAVSKVPFIQRVRSNVAKWFGGRSSKDKRNANNSSDTLSSASSASTFGKASRGGDSRRSSLRGDEDIFRLSKFSGQGEHPLAQSVTASPVEEESWASYFESLPVLSENKPVIAPTVTPRPGPPRRAKSSMSTAESTKTVKQSRMDSTPTGRPRSGVTPSIIEALGTTSIGSIFSGATRRASGAFGSRSRRSSPTGETPSLDGDRRSEPSLAVSNASAVGHMRASGLWNADSASSGSRLSMPVGHRRNRSQQLAGKSSAESFNLTKEALLRRRRSDIEPSAENALAPKLESAMYSTDSLQLPALAPPPDHAYVVDPHHADPPQNGLNGSTPSAATISSSSADDFTSGMSQSASHPSIPSVVSGASSLSGDGLYFGFKDRDSDTASQVPSILRTGETVKARLPGSPRPSEEDESRYYCDDEEEESDSEDEVLVIGKKKPPPKSENKPTLKSS
ncbi:hypothetical protein N7533_002659 [Penicillium manginii]|uniref:uncharacterized protein n=1 Tax=Penicillium manginii TaxID=203109 RepID=UPI002547806A|nr:uncharacterized protein N7533_002659 [Penicillium manginii]KAJ5763978.1 hypothetical protein N7533_002659 [Penicillium manginii]